MALTERIRVLFEVDDKGSFGKIRKDIAQADTATGKMKAGFAGLGDSLKQNVTGAAIAAGSALVAFGVKSVKAFTDSALAASKFSDATGLGVEDASRWIEVASDVGVEATTIQGAFQKMNKSIADGKSSWTEYGIEVVKTKDGLTDSNATMVQALSRIGAIEDPTLRAKAAQEVFGKSYGEVAELMEMDAKSLQAALASVSDEQVIDEAEVRKAKAFRAAMDSLQDSFTRLQMAIGEELTPTITEAAEGIQEIIDSPLIEWLGKASRAIDKVTIDIADIATGFRVAGEAIDIVLGKDVPGAMADWKKGTDDAGDATRDLSADLDDLDRQAAKAESALDAAERSARDLSDAFDALMGNLDQEEKWEAFNEAVWNLADGSGNAAAEMRDWKRAAAELVTGLEDMPEEQKTALLLQINDGDKATVDAILFEYQRGVNVPVRFVGQGQVGFMKNARGTPPGGSPGGLTLVGEEGPELVEMPKGAHVTPAPETARMLSGTGGSGVVASGPSINVTINAGLGANGAQIGTELVKFLKQHERLNGTGWRT